MRPIFKILYRFYRLAAWLRYRGQRRFTKAGLAVLGGVVIAGVMGPDTDNNVAYQAFTLLTAILAMSVAGGWFFRARFSVTRLMPQFGTVGIPLNYTVRLRNLSSHPQVGLVLLENLTDPRPSFEYWLSVQKAEERRIRSFRVSGRRRRRSFMPARIQPALIPPAAPGQDTDVRVQMTPLRRGSLRLSGVTVARPDALGLYCALSKVAAPQSILILPKRYPLPPIALPGTMKFQQGGVALASNVGQSDEFVSLRDYRHGDPLRHIHWRTWARVGKPVVKEFEDEFFVRHALILDTFTDHPQSEAFEEAVAVAASFACTIQTQESLLDLLFVGPESYCFTSGRGLAQGDQMLEILAGVQACGDRPFGTLEHVVLGHVNAVSGCICVLLSWDEPRRQLVEKLCSLGVPVLVLVVVEHGQAKKLDPGPLHAQPDHLHVLEVGRIEQQLAGLVFTP